MKKIVCFGDSNTYGYIPGEGGRYPSEIRYTGILAALLAPYGYCLSEAGVNGRTTVFDDNTAPQRNGSKELGSILRENDPADVFVIMLGTNDCKTRFHADVAAITEGMEILVSMIRVFDSRIRILLTAPPAIDPSVRIGMFRENFDEESIAKSRQLGEAYRELAYRTGCDFLDASKVIHTDPKDGIHLSAEAHAGLAHAIAHSLLKTPFNV